MKKTYLTLLGCLTFKAVLLILVVSFLGIALSPDEAQYWTWSQDLDFGYYSKPPGIAWQIYLTTLLFGNNELGVRFGAIVIGFLIALAIYHLSINCKVSTKGAFWSSLLFAASPLGFYLSFASTTDGGAILGIAMASAILVKGMHEKKAPHYPLFGLCILFSALFKWIAFVLYIFVFILLIIYPWMRKRSVWMGVFISLAALLPSLYWNFFHDFATFKHVFYTIFNQSAEVSKKGNFFDFLGAQILLLSPITFIIFLMVLFKRKENRALLFCSLYSMGFLIYLLFSITKKMQPNWASYFYPTAFVLVAWYGCEIMKKGIKWIYAAFLLALFFSLGSFAVPFTALPYQWNPFRQSLGWQRLDKALLEKGYDPEKDFLFADTYQMASLLSFYGPKQKRAYFFNIRQNRKNQFSYWPSISKEKNKIGYFVLAENILQENPWYENFYTEKLKIYCQKVDFLGSISLFESNGLSVKRAFFFRCQNYEGNWPKSPEIY